MANTNPSSSAPGSRAPSAPGSPRSSRPEICGTDAPERPYPIYLRGEVERGFGRGGKELGCPTANLPARVLGPSSPVTRTGVYFGFARVLPQDPEDFTAAADQDGEPGEAEEEEEEEDDEVILGASPLRDGAESTSGVFNGFPLSKGKSRQGSKSSIHAASGKGLDKEVEVSAAEHRAGEEEHRRGLSAASSSGSLRRKRALRVHLHADDSRVFPMVMSVGWNPFYKNTMKTAEVHIMHKFDSDFYGLEVRVVVLGYIRPEYNYVSREALIDDIEKDKQVALNSLGRPLYQDYSRDPFLGKQP